MSTNSIEICDNYKYLSKFFGAITIDHQKGENLWPIANKSLVKLKEENPNLLIFPEDLGAPQDGFDDNENLICSLYPTTNKGRYILETGNIMGWVGCGDTQLRIYSRFDSTINDNDQDKDSKLKPKNNFFMYYILSKLGAFHLTSLDYDKGEDNVLNNLLGLMFPAFLKNAVTQGLYKEYRTFERNDSNVRGGIDFNRHLRRNNPFMGKVAYRTREFSFDNDVTQLIRHTIEYLESSPMGAIILGGDAETRQCADVIRQATPTYNEKERGTIINNNLRPKMHPYYTDYISLQKLCMQILHEEGINYGVNSDDKVHGILFDGAWLWEAYIFKLLEESRLGFIHPDNIAKTDAFKLFKKRDREEGQFDEDNRNAYPDFYNDTCVLDAKYKHLEKRVQREDLYQVISYMHTMPRDIGGYVFPYQTKDRENVQTKTYELWGHNGHGGFISTIPLKIPYYKNDNWEKFQDGMVDAEKDFIERICQLLGCNNSDR